MSSSKLITIPGKSYPINLSDPIDGAENFTWGEALRNGSRLPKNWRITANIIKLANVLQSYRDTHFKGKRITVHSWLRLGDGRSAHDHGLAADFSVEGMSHQQVQALMLKHHNGGVGSYNAHTHIDLWYKRSWRGKSQ